MQCMQYHMSSFRSPTVDCKRQAARAVCFVINSQNCMFLFPWIRFKFFLNLQYELDNLQDSFRFRFSGEKPPENGRSEWLRSCTISHINRTFSYFSRPFDVLIIIIILLDVGSWCPRRFSCNIQTAISWEHNLLFLAAPEQYIQRVRSLRGRWKLLRFITCRTTA